MTDHSSMGTTVFSRALTLTGILLLWACQPSPEPEQVTDPTPKTLSTAVDQLSEAGTANKGHQKGIVQGDISALKRSPRQSSIEVTEQTCTATAYTSAGDAAGMLLYQEPNQDAAAIGTVPTQEPVVVTVARAQPPWLYITSNPDNPEAQFESGWIQGNLLVTQVRSLDTSRPGSTAPLQAAPELAAAPLVEVATGTEVAVIGCAGDWLKVQSPENEAGWLAPEHQCGNPFSTCP